MRLWRRLADWVLPPGRVTAAWPPFGISAPTLLTDGWTARDPRDDDDDRRVRLGTPPRAAPGRRLVDERDPWR